MGAAIHVNVKDDYPLLLAETPGEGLFMLDTLCEKRHISKQEGVSGTVYVTIKEKGLAHLDEIERQHPKSNEAFVAMWFPKPEDPESNILTEAYERGFHPAIKEAGYDPIRIDKEEFLGKIDDEIIARIRQSRFLVADFTGQRGGVYYEAGFAHGLGIPVIFTCEKNYFESHKVNFDTRQYNHIDWADTSDLYNRLLKRIRETIV
ncbi:MAG: hypothetical protein A2Z34_04955 [Planctomycetes bacterium RBG_16_59_8]|nr:MAG: hypothetical protein A2Z34_04955 [Planctomycetes bacterium RBG_16_59_8]